MTDPECEDNMKSMLYPYPNENLVCDDSSSNFSFSENEVDCIMTYLNDITELQFPDNNDVNTTDGILIGSVETEVEVEDNQVEQLELLPSIELPISPLLSTNTANFTSGDDDETISLIADRFPVYNPPISIDQPPDPPRSKLTKELRIVILELYQWYPPDMTVKKIADRITYDWLVPHYK